MQEIGYKKQVERWDVQEIVLRGKSDKNPFVDYNIFGCFTGKNEKVTVDGFYDGDGIYKVRFMPSFEGEYTYKVAGTFADEGAEGEFAVTPATEGNHGPVRVANTYHFAYEDATPYYSIGTTCYVWALQSDEMIAKTLESLKESAFNTAHFAHIETCILALRDMGIEADLIVMHPYDRWGFSEMTAKQDDLYWEYVLARFSAYRNIWWSLANEYDLFPKKSLADWERYAKMVCEKDPYNHLRSIHNCLQFYDYRRPWITHCSIQRIDLYKSAELVEEWREIYKKPIVLDEIAYEGNIQHGWGNISGKEMTRRFWEAALRGGYPGHGETYMNDKDVLWWSHGGVLRGESHKRFQFLYDILLQTPGIGLCPCEKSPWDEIWAVPEESAQKVKKVKDYYLMYFSFMQPSFKEYYFDDESEFEVNVIDTWNMAIESRGVCKGRFKVELPGRQYMAIQIKKVQ